MGLADLSSLIVQWHPTADWNAALADGDWTTINLPITLLWYRRGYKRGQQRVEAGEFRCTFRDPTRSMDPIRDTSPNYRKGRRQFRVRITVGGITYTVFRGITSGWEPDWLLNEFTVTMRGTDRSPAFEGVFVPSVFEQVVKALNPPIWIRGGVGAKPVADGSGMHIIPNHGSALTAGTAIGIDPNGQAALSYDKSSSLTVSQSGDVGVGVAVPDLSGPFCLTATFSTDKQGALFGQGPTGTENDIVFGVSWDPPADRLSIYIDDDVAPAVFLHTDEVVADNAPHIGTAQWDGQVLRLKVDSAGDKVGPLLAPPVPNPRAGLALVGNSRDSLHPFGGRIGDIIAWDDVISPASIAEMHAAALLPWDGLRSDQVIAKVLDYVGIAASERNLEVGQETMGPSRCQASALVCCERPAATEGGLFFFDREGKATFYARDHVGTGGVTRSTRPTLGQIKLQDLKVSMDERTYYTVGKAYVAAGDPLEVVYRHANADVDGELVWAPETEYEDQTAALAGAQRAVGTGEARPHFTNAVTIAEDINFAQLLIRDVWDTLDITGYPGGVAETMSSRILEVEHEMDGVTWTTKLTLEATS